MSADSPYAPPKADVVDAQHQGELASLGKRFFGGLIDGVISIVCGIPIMSALGVWDAIKQGIEPPFSSLFVSTIFGFIVFILLHGYFLHTSGQTIGKKLMGTQIVDLSNRVPPLGKILLLRYLPISLLSLIPMVGNFIGLVDGVFVFRRDKRCLHDHIAGTQVINYIKS